MNWSKEWAAPIAPLPDAIAQAAKEGPIGHFLTVKDGNKNRTICTTIIGDLALEFDDREEIDGKPNLNTGWCMYHVPTLSKFDKAVPAIPCNYCIDETGKCFVDNCENCMNERVRKPDEYSYDKSALLNWMTKVQAEGMYPTAWQILRGLTPDNYDGKAQAAKDIIMKHCLATAVE